MAIFFSHLLIDDECHRDSEGRDLTDLAAARKAALRDMLAVIADYEQSGARISEFALSSMT